MTQPKLKTTPFDIAKYLDDEEVIAEYLSEAAADENPAVFLKAIGDVAKARGMTGIATKSGLGRESLYKAFAAGAKPRHETVQSVLRALGMKIAIVPAAEESVAETPRIAMA
ncbi:MAG: putative addiction module antidote protein [Azospirillum sp.]|nr:putative addiction module antidote protein [Azospirillum sp.]